MRFFKIARKKLKSKGGFTLIELLVALAIVVMLSLMISVGTSVGARVQRESTFVAESDILASTINTALQDVLRYAEIEPCLDDTTIEAMPDDTQKFLERNKSALAGATLLKVNDGSEKCVITNNNYGITSGALVLANHDGKNRLAIKFQEYEKGSGGRRDPIPYDGDDDNNGLKPHYLVSHGVYTTLIIKDFKIEYTGAVEKDGIYVGGVFTVSYTISEPGSNPMKKNVEVSFRPANGDAPTTAATTTTPTVPTT